MTKIVHIRIKRLSNMRISWTRESLNFLPEWILFLSEGGCWPGRWRVCPTLTSTSGPRTRRWRTGGGDIPASSGLSWTQRSVGSIDRVWVIQAPHCHGDLIWHPPISLGRVSTDEGIFQQSFNIKVKILYFIRSIWIWSVTYNVHLTVREHLYNYSQNGISALS